ncbi:hypothetical protein BKP37_07270 [Anaerobacillus alkalilacustris]|uniref:YpoC-like domain-containing protein n=1 Tax=Anaerobacillus alkalilacustris TaxID=393763 RepID=A0A1S2LRM4_9BACI|nr:hypothetical protein [Anaerobacillus alkalilacustris]OIJ14773.1 hypothetical protein BKP37_07270 [Anaerobacillus alkalilacustris]
MKEIKMPEEFILSPFFEIGDTIFFGSESSFEELINKQPLYFDILYRKQKNTIKPWEDKNTYIPILLEIWKSEKPIITNYFSERKRKEAMEPMKLMIMNFIAFLFWLNDKPVPELKNITPHINLLNTKPVNAVERIAYVLSVPNHHHAFTQLDQLYIELNKKYAVIKLKSV